MRRFTNRAFLLALSILRFNKLDARSRFHQGRQPSEPLQSLYISSANAMDLSAALDISDSDLQIFAWILHKGVHELDKSWLAQLPLKSAVNIIDSLQLSLDTIRQGDGDGMDIPCNIEDFRRRTIHLLVKLEGHYKALPDALFLKRVQCHDTTDPEFIGGHSDVYRGKHLGSHVAMKKLRVNKKDREKLYMRLGREGTLWRQLHHQHILCFLGFDATTFPNYYVFVSPWMENGHLTSYIESAHLSGKGINRLLREVVEGLAYLHRQTVFHGDLRAANILIDGDGQVRLSDFGLSRIIATPMAFSSTKTKTNIRWAAPELIHGSTRSPTAQADMYAFASVCLEAYTLHEPYRGIDPIAVVKLVVEFCPPSRPSVDECHGNMLPDALWVVMHTCWMATPDSRPTAQHLLAHPPNITGWSPSS